MSYYQSPYNASSDESPSSYPGFTIAKLPPISVNQNDLDTTSAASSARCYKSSRRLSRSRLHKTVSDDSLAIRYRRMKCAVIVMTTLMIVASMLLVGVSLAMAEHIDDLVRQVSGLSTTRRPFSSTSIEHSTKRTIRPSASGER